MPAMHHLTRLLDAIWNLAMGLFLGLSAGAVVAVILAFQTTRSETVLAKPRAMPYADPRFELDWPGYVAGAIGNRLFSVVGVLVLILVGVALLAMIGRILIAIRAESGRHHKPAWAVRILAMLILTVALALASQNVLAMNDAWPTLYDPVATDAQLLSARHHFESLHQKSERYVGTAWLAGALALLITPWCAHAATKQGETASRKGAKAQS